MLYMFHMKQFTSKSQKRGEIGEEIAAKYLIANEYNILERNYTQKVGEIDIISKKGNIIYFIEVKSYSLTFVSHETKNYSASENLTKSKFEKIKRTAISYLSNNKVSCETFEFKIIVVRLDLIVRKGRIVLFENI
jgi:putative endonuclease